MERDCESELSKLNIEQNACIYHFGASVIHGQRSNILRLLYDSINDSMLKFAVIIARHNGKWVFCKHKERNEYYGAAEPPVRCGESHLSGLTEPPHFFIKLLCHCWVQSIYFSHREVFSWVNTFNIDLIGIIRYAIHDGIGKSTFTITDLLVPLTFTELRTKDC